MTFKESLASDAKAVFLNTDEYADSVTYTPVSGTPSTIPCVLLFGMEQSQGRGGVSSVADALVARSDVDIPAYGDTITLDDVVWKVVAILAKDSAVSQLSLRKDKSERPIYR